MNNQVKSRYQPDVVSPPGETLQETLTVLGLSQAELAERTGRPKKTINEIILGKSSITPETALQLERVLGVPSHFWMNREAQYRNWLARMEEQEKLSKQLDWLKRLPIADMIKLGWIEKHREPIEQLKEVLNFYGVASPELIELNEQIAFRKSRLHESDPWALSAWLRKGLLEIQKVTCLAYEAKKFTGILQQVRGLTVLPPEIFVPELQKLCATCGVAVVFISELPKGRVSGATYWTSPQKAAIQLSLRYKRDDHLWFTFFHEAGHILLHEKREVFLEDDKKNTADTREKEADGFARDLLINPKDFAKLLQIGENGYSAASVEKFAKNIGVAPGIVVGRLQHEGLIPHSYLNDLKHKLEWAKQTAV